MTVVERREIALVDLLDRLLAGGVVITGDITLRHRRRRPRPHRPQRPDQLRERERPVAVGGILVTQARNRNRNRLDLEPDTVERDLVKLVLTVVELLRQLMERQALRRFDDGGLTEEQEERIGLTLMLLDDRMTELRERYGLRPEDLNLDLGPLGPLLPRE
ncbi:hypothetical protein QF037_002142 [Streptomyces canus]|nr:hypothetical protein [Streptomyces canus]